MTLKFYPAKAADGEWYVYFDGHELPVKGPMSKGAAYRLAEAYNQEERIREFSEQAWKGWGETLQEDQRRLDEEAKERKWKQFLKELLQKNEELQELLQEILERVFERMLAEVEEQAEAERDTFGAKPGM